MKNTFKIAAIAFAFAAAFTSCKDKETTVDETTTETVIETDTMAMPPVTEEVPADTTTTGEPTGTATPPTN